MCEQNLIKELLSPQERGKFRQLISKAKTPLWIYWTEFVRHYLREGKSEATIRSVRDTLKFLLRNLRILTVEDCNNPTILREALFEAKENRNWSASTLNTYRKNINTYFLWLEDMDYVEANKIKKIRKCKELQSENLTLTEDQVSQLRTHIFTGRRNSQFERYRNALFFDMLILTGARPAELLEVRMIDIKKQDGKYTLSIRGKKQKGRIRYYHMPSTLVGLFKMFVMIRQELGRDELKIFCSQSKRTGWTYKGVSKLVTKLSKELGFTVTCYGIRRFVATNLYLKGVDLESIKNHLGHTRITTTYRYIERSCALTKDGSDEMAKLLE